MAAPGRWELPGGPAPAMWGSATPPDLARGPSWLTVWTITIVGLLLVAGVAEWAIIANPPTQVAPIVGPPGWTTFRESAPVAQGFADRVPGGPWSIAFAQGLASDLPWSPTLAGSLGPTPACAARLAGLSLFTYWNPAAYPKSTAPTTYTSGTAPLWTFGFRNPLGDVVIISDVDGSIGYNGVWSASSGCLAATSASYSPGFSPTSVLDTPAVAAIVRADPGTQPPRPPFDPLDPSSPFSTFVLYSLGAWATGAVSYSPNEGFPNDRSPSWWVTFGSCGLAGVSGVVSSSIAQVNATTGAYRPSGFSYQQACGVVGLNGSFGSAALTTLPNAQGSIESWSLHLRPETSAVPAPRNWDLVTTDSLRPVLLINDSLNPTPFTQEVPSAAATCAVGAKTLSDCLPTSLGWYVVLTDASGAWLDDYPSAAGGTSWTVPGVTVVTGDQIHLVVPLETPAVKEFQLTTAGPEYNVGLAYVDL